MDILEKSKSVMIGHAVGDALGVPVEFASREELEEAPVETMEGNGTYPVPKGTWSDDTSMSLATLDSLHYGINYEDMMEKFCDWVNDAKYTPTGLVFDMGRTVMKSLMAYLQRHGDALSCGQKSVLDNGNGSLMRIHPVALYLYDKEMPLLDKMKVIHKTSSLTHAHARAKVACGIYTFVLWEIISNPTKDAIAEGMRKARNFYWKNEEDSAKSLFSRALLNIGKGYLNNAEKDLYPMLDRSEIRSSGYVVDTLEAAVWCLMNTDSYKDCVLTAVNLGDDTDTVAAIAGGLAGALYGYDSIPEDWRNTLIKRDYIENICEEVFGMPT